MIEKEEVKDKKEKDEKVEVKDENKMDNKKKQVKKEAIKDINLYINDKNEVIIDNNINKTVTENKWKKLLILGKLLNF